MINLEPEAILEVDIHKVRRLCHSLFAAEYAEKVTT